MDILLHGYCRENILDNGIIILNEIYIMQFLNTNDTISDAEKLNLCIFQNCKGAVTNKSVAKVGILEQPRGGERGLKHVK